MSAQGTEKAQKSQQARGGQVKNYDGSKTLAQLTEQAVKDGTELGQQMNAGTVKGSVTEKPAKPLLADKNARVRRFIDQLRGKQIVATKVEGKKGAWDIDTGGDTSVQAWLDREAALEGGAKVTKKVGKGHYTVDLELAPAKVGHQPPSKPEKPATA